MQNQLLSLEFSAHFILFASDLITQEYNLTVYTTQPRISLDSTVIALRLYNHLDQHHWCEMRYSHCFMHRTKKR